MVTPTYLEVEKGDHRYRNPDTTEPVCENMAMQQVPPNSTKIYCSHRSQSGLLLDNNHMNIRIPFHHGVDDGARTRDLQDHNLAL